jgi:hypothetical protein
MVRLDYSILFAKGATQIVDIPIDPQGTGDVYINDFIEATIVIKGTDNVTRCEQAMLLAIGVSPHQSTSANQSHGKTSKHATN